MATVVVTACGKSFMPWEGLRGNRMLSAGQCLPMTATVHP
jgi:hypothetical protein